MTAVRLVAMDKPNSLNIPELAHGVTVHMARDSQAAVPIEMPLMWEGTSLESIQDV